jgi:nucleotidyltransferase/DNA polymerase involved in DNA repair
MHEMILSLCRELEERDIYSRTIGIRIRYTGFISRTRSVTLMQPTREVRIIEQAIDGLFAEMWDQTPVRLIGVRLSGLVHPDPVQRSLSDF